MNHVAMDSHAAQACGNCNGFVRDHPNLRSPAIRLHRKTCSSAVQRAYANLFQSRDNLSGYLVGFIGRVMKLKIGDRTCWSSDVLAIHFHDKAHERLRAWEKR